MSLSGGNGVNLAHKRVGALDGMAVDFKDDVAGSEAGIIRGAVRANALNGRAIDMLGNVQLLAKIRRQLGDCEAKPSVLRRAWIRSCPRLRYSRGIRRR